MPRIITTKTAGCEDRTCPATWDTSDPEWVGIRIKRPEAGDDLTAAGFAGIKVVRPDREMNAVVVAQKR